MADYLLTALVTLFVTMDPIGLAPVFPMVTQGASAGMRRRTALVASVTAACVLTAFALVGQPLLTALGITLPAFRVSGGLLLFWIAFEMLFDLGMARKAGSARAAAAEPDRVPPAAVFPLAIPLMAGPGAISATILTASRAPDWLAVAGLIGVILLLVGACYVVFLQAARIERALGPTGRLVVTRLLGLLLAALAVQFVADGVAAFIRGAAG